MAKKNRLSPWQILFIIKKAMKIKLSIKQLKSAIEKTGEVKFPITIYLNQVEKEEFAELIKLIKSLRKD